MKRFFQFFALAAALLLAGSMPAATVVGSLRSILGHSNTVDLVVAAKSTPLISGTNLIYGPFEKITATNGEVNTTMELGRYILEVRPGGMQFAIQVPDTNGTVNITQLLTNNLSFTYAPPGQDVIDANAQGLALPTLSGSLRNIRGQALTVQLTIKPLTTPLAGYPTVVYSKEEKLTATNGDFSTPLYAGDYEGMVTPGGMVFTFAMPNTNGNFALTALLTTNLHYAFRSSPVYLPLVGGTMLGPLATTQTNFATNEFVPRWWIEANVTGNGNIDTNAFQPANGNLTNFAKFGTNTFPNTNRTINTMAPLTGGGDLSQDRTIAIPKATGSADGYLAAVDFGTFNGKQDHSVNLDGLSLFGTNEFAFLAALGTMSKERTNDWLRGMLASLPLSIQTNNDGTVTLSILIRTNDLPGNLPGLAAYPTNSFLGATAAAGGDLTGNYPNPTLAAIVTAGTATKVTFDAKGRITATNSLSTNDLPGNLPGLAAYPTNSFLGATAAAGGDLTGNYPNPTLASIVTAGTATKVTFDAKGRITATNSLSTNDLPGNLPGLAAYPTNSFLGATAAAGGDLTGNYPNPTFAAIITAGTATKVTFDAKGRITATNSLSTNDLPGNLPGLAAYPTNSFLGATAAAGGDLTGNFPNPTLASIVTAGTGLPTFDAKGRITSTNAISLANLSDGARVTNVETYTNAFDELTVTLYGGSSAIAVGQTSYKTLKKAFTVYGWNIVAFPSGSTISVDFWGTNTIPTSSNTRTGGAYVGVTNTLSASNSVAAWYTNWVVNDTIAFNVITNISTTNAVITLYGRH